MMGVHDWDVRALRVGVVRRRDQRFALLDAIVADALRTAGRVLKVDRHPSPLAQSDRLGVSVADALDAVRLPVVDAETRVTGEHAWLGPIVDSGQQRVAPA